jgi:lysophospholipase L1-like esterase
MATILCYGDSNTWGFDPATCERLPREKRWPAVLRRHLPAGWEVIEEALCGRTTVLDDPFEGGRNGLAYLAPCLESHLPVDLVVLMLGTNDVKSFFPFEGAGIAAGAGRLVDVIQGSRCGPAQGAPKVLLVAPPPVALARPLSRVWGFDEVAVRRSRDLAGYYQAVAERRSCSFLDAGALVSVSPLDGVHLDEAAAAKLGEAVAAKMGPLLGE